MKIAMIGAGYVGLVSGACFSDFGHEVVCVDNDRAKVAHGDSGPMRDRMRSCQKLEVSRLHGRFQSPLGERWTSLDGQSHQVKPE